MPPRRPILAADSNFVIDLAERQNVAMEVLGLIIQTFAPARILLPPIVLHELVGMTRRSEDPKLQRLARAAFPKLFGWGFTPLNTVPVELGQITEIARRLQRADLLPVEEFNDSVLLVESAFLDASLLITQDRHLLDVDYQRASLLLGEFGLKVPVIASPRDLLRKFG